MALTIKFFEGLKKVKDLVSVGYIPVDMEPRKDSMRLAASGALFNTAVSLEESTMANLPVAENTLRFSFSDLGYDPVAAGVGSLGTWSKCNTRYSNVWDWTYTSTDWHEAFKGAFQDKGNEVSVIAAGDTSSVTDVSGMFSGIYSNQPNQSTYNVTVRNNVVDCVNFDISGCSDARRMFTASSLRHARMDLSAVTSSLLYLYADTMLVDVGDIDCSATAYVGFMFTRCAELRSVGNVTVSSTCEDAPGMFAYCENLEHFGGFTGDTGSLHNFQACFQLCYALKSVDNKLDATACSGSNDLVATFSSCNSLKEIPIENIGSSVTSLYATFNGCHSATAVPQMDTSGVTDFRNAFGGMRSLETLPDIDVSAATNVTSMFSNCVKAKYGIVEMYTSLSEVATIGSHANTFLNCGIDTEEGRAALEQIPQSWGGLAEG